MEDALLFCRRRFESALEQSGDLKHALAVLREDENEAEQIWSDSNAMELRRRDLEPHGAAAARQTEALATAIEAGRDLLTSLEEASRAERAVISAVAATRAEVQSAMAATVDAERSIDAAKVSVQSAEDACAGAGRMLAGL